VDLKLHTNELHAKKEDANYLKFWLVFLNAELNNLTQCNVSALRNIFNFIIVVIENVVQVEQLVHFVCFPEAVGFGIGFQVYQVQA
jgi:hypothetical protein